MNSSNLPQAGDKVLIISPAYVAGKSGIVCGKEVFSNGELSGRWLIEIASESLVLSLSVNDFKMLNK
ncbi:MAG: hypothetical protein HC903_23335 [Methylacidiphilales bacterium]|nr:hypothetical protein [Candidatus Methylacidiphilales bacterium]NJR18797.1 hypothetical protein [Calothrix sp. CSU_2_0]